MSIVYCTVCHGAIADKKVDARGRPVCFSDDCPWLKDISVRLRNAADQGTIYGLHCALEREAAATIEHLCLQLNAAEERADNMTAHMAKRMSEWHDREVKRLRDALETVVELKYDHESMVDVARMALEKVDNE